MAEKEVCNFPDNGIRMKRIEVVYTGGRATHILLCAFWVARIVVQWPFPHPLGTEANLLTAYLTLPHVPVLLPVFLHSPTGKAIQAVGKILYCWESVSVFWAISLQCGRQWFGEE